MKRRLVTIGIVVVGIIGATVVLAGYTTTHKPGERVQLNGTVTEYDPTPAFTDGLIKFAINGHSVDIGGGMRPEAVVGGSIYGPIAKGDKVEAMVKRGGDGGPEFTIYACSDCYIRKVQ